MNHGSHRHGLGRNRLDSERRRDMSGGGFEGRARRGKLFDSAQLQLVLLRLIADRQRHGYELMRDIETRTGGAYVPSPGVVYPTLTMLLEMGLVAEAEMPGARKTFAITDAGRQLVSERADQVEALLGRLDALGNASARADGAPVRRAMGNLRQVLQAKLSKPETTDQHLLEAARIIDEAAGRIERMT